MRFQLFVAAILQFASIALCSSYYGDREQTLVLHSRPLLLRPGEVHNAIQVCVAVVVVFDEN